METKESVGEIYWSEAEFEHVIYHDLLERIAEHKVMQLAWIVEDKRNGSIRAVCADGPDWIAFMLGKYDSVQSAKDDLMRAFR